MNILTVILHEGAKQNLIDILLDIDEVRGFTAIKAEGYFRNHSKKPF